MVRDEGKVDLAVIDNFIESGLLKYFTEAIRTHVRKITEMESSPEYLAIQRRLAINEAELQAAREELAVLAAQRQALDAKANA